jgi:hypothetical protein
MAENLHEIIARKRSHHYLEYVSSESANDDKRDDYETIQRGIAQHCAEIRIAQVKLTKLVIILIKLCSSAESL